MTDIIQNHLDLYSMSFQELALRLILAVIFGLVIGLDRDNKDKPVDFRVYVIIVTATTVLAIMALELSFYYNNDDKFLSLDLGKIIAGVLTGIGFLGAGAIIKVDDKQVIGTTTGASIWACGALGLCLGFGMYGLAVALFVTLAITLYIARKIYSHFEK